MKRMNVPMFALSLVLLVSCLFGCSRAETPSGAPTETPGENDGEATKPSSPWAEFFADAWSLPDFNYSKENWNQALAAQGDVAPETLTPYNAEEFLHWLGDEQVAFRGWGKTESLVEMGFSSVICDPVGFNRDFPIECICRLDDSHLYAIYRLTSGENDLYLYAVFEDVYAGSNLSDDEVLWWFLGEYYYGAEELSMEDCAGLQVGDTATEAEALLHCVGDEALRPRFDSTFSVYCLLKDGVLIIDFGLDEECGDMSETWVSKDKSAMLESYRIWQINIYRYGEKKENLSEIHRNDRLAMCGFTD